MTNEMRKDVVIGIFVALVSRFEDSFNKSEKEMWERIESHINEIYYQDKK